MHQKKIALVLVTAVGAVLVGCSSGSVGPVKGSLDDVKYVKSQKAVPAKTHTTSKQVKQTKQSCSGTGKKRSCKTVSNGYRTVTVTVTDKPSKPYRSAMYCVELDNVNGNKDHDDQWYEVSWTTYAKWSTKDEGTKVGSMQYIRELSSCKR